MRRSIVALSCAASLVVATGCGSDAGSAGEFDFPDDTLDGFSDDAGADDTGADDTGGDTTGEDTGSDASADATPDTLDTGSTGEPGDPCIEDADCVTFLCVYLDAALDEGFCSSPCRDADDCDEGSSCVLLTSEGDGDRVCVPDDLCVDGDGDGWGIGPSCLGRDCDDESGDVNPAADEACNGVDDDCDDEVDESIVGEGVDCETGFLGVCGAGVRVCDDGLFECEARSAPGTETCNDLDDDCDGVIDEGEDDGPLTQACYDGPEETRGMGVCTDGVRTCDRGDYSSCAGQVLPTDEICNGEDDDCDGIVDEDATDVRTWYTDSDGDGYGAPGTEAVACTPADDQVDNDDDCNDDLTDVNPGVDEVCDGVDNDCDLAVDEPDAADALTWYQDLDGDGFGDPLRSQLACNDPGDTWVRDDTDCDDALDTVNPDADEVCNGRDDNCDRAIDEDTAVDAPTFYADDDGDGFGRDDDTRNACERPLGYADRAGDCDDDSFAVNPSRVAICNGVDDDCVNGIDGADAIDASVFYADDDEDTWGDPTTSTRACTTPDGYVARASDCDDTRPEVNPDGTEVCNGRDDDCDRSIDESATDATVWYRDRDEDTWGNADVTERACAAPDGYIARAGDCDDGNDDRFPFNPEVCDGIDNDCDTAVDEEVLTTFYLDADRDTWGVDGETVEACTRPTGFAVRGGDCNDSSDVAYPGATEVCDEIDNDCDRSTDEGVQTTYYLDGDGDTWGRDDRTTLACSQPGGYVGRGGDCNDSTNRAYPGATEVCDEIDNDCDRSTDEGVQTTYFRDADGDRYGNPSASTLACSAPAGYITDNRDCDDSRATTNPGAAEVCNGRNDDCDGSTDESCPTGLTLYSYDYGPQYGGSGGTQYLDTCPTGYALAGMNLWTGSEVDAVQAYCRQLTLSTNTAPDPYTYDVTVGTARTLSKRGGGGGTLRSARCNTGEVVTGIFGRSGARIDQLGFRCSQLGVSGAPASDDVTFSGGASRGGYGGGGGSSFTYNCPAGEVVVGIGGRYGSRVDAFRVRCGAIDTTP